LVVAAEMSLPLLPVDTIEFAAGPDAYLESARRQHPWLARFSQGYVVHGYKAVADMLADDENLAPGLGPIIDFYGVRDTMWARFMTEIVLSVSGPTHTRLRASVGGAFTPRRANQVRPLMQRAITELLDEWAPKGEFNFADFASYFPVTVMCGLLGVSPEPVPRLRKVVEDHISSLAMNMDTKPHFLAAWDELWEFADTLVNEREASGAYDEESLLDALIAVKRSGQLDETELRFMVLTIFLAGYDTSKNQLAMMMMLLLDRPEIYARCAEDKEFCGKVVQEAMRHSSIGTAYREVGKTFSYEGCEFHKGELLLFLPPLAGRDPLMFPDPLKFDPDRDNAGRHLAFGRGPHICMGMFIARAQLQEGLHLIAQRLKNPRLNGEIVWRQFLGAWGPSDLPIAFDPA
jgi:cytochrome P450